MKNTVEVCNSTEIALMTVKSYWSENMSADKRAPLVLTIVYDKSEQVILSLRSVKAVSEKGDLFHVNGNYFVDGSAIVIMSYDPVQEDM